MWMQTSCAVMESQSLKCKSGYTVMACSPHSKKSGGVSVPTARFALCDVPLLWHCCLQECGRVFLTSVRFAPCSVPLVLLSSGARFAPCNAPLALLSSGAWKGFFAHCPLCRMHCSSGTVVFRSPLCPVQCSSGTVVFRSLEGFLCPLNKQGS